MSENTYGDALSAPFWEAASAHRLVLQHCDACGAHQFYPRPFCLACESDELRWVDAAGSGTIYSMTTVRLAMLPELPPPYVVAVVQLDEGPRLTSNIVGDGAVIGGRVRLAWRERDQLPPLPVFETLAG